MAKLIPAAERLVRARALIQKAYEVPLPAAAEGGKYDFSYIAQVKDLTRQARDYVKFITLTPSASEEVKADVKRIYEEAERAEKELLH